MKTAIRTETGEVVADPPSDRARAEGMPKLPALDGLRATAILIVMAAHLGLGKVVPGGFGVTIFFFLSGYLITTLLRLEAARTGRVSLRRFYLKRTLRIIPPMVMTIVLLAVAVARGWMPGHVSGASTAADLLFLTNYAPELGIAGGVPVPLWSLDIEEHYYILFSTLFALVFARMASRRAAAICLALALAVLGMRIVTALTTPDIGRIYYWSHTRIDSILWGSVLALWNNPVADRNAWRPRAWHLAAAAAVLVACLAVRSEVFRETLRYTLQGGALLVVFSYALQDRGWFGRALGAAPLRLVALLSYTLYLAHMPAFALADEWRLPLAPVWGVAMAFAYAGAMYLAVERPLARWRRRA